MYHVSIPRASGVITMLERSSPSWLKRFGDTAWYSLWLTSSEWPLSSSGAGGAGRVVVGQVEAVRLVRRQELRVGAAARVAAGRLLQRRCPRRSSGRSGRCGCRSARARARSGRSRRPRGRRSARAARGRTGCGPRAAATGAPRPSGCRPRASTPPAGRTPRRTRRSSPAARRPAAWPSRGPAGTCLYAPACGSARPLIAYSVTVRPRTYGIERHGTSTSIAFSARLTACRCSRSRRPRRSVIQPPVPQKVMKCRRPASRCRRRRASPRPRARGRVSIAERDGGRVALLHRLEEGGDVQPGAARRHAQLAQVGGVVAVAGRVGRVPVVAAGGRERGAEHGRVRDAVEVGAVVVVEPVVVDQLALRHARLAGEHRGVAAPVGEAAVGAVRAGRCGERGKRRPRSTNAIAVRSPKRAAQSSCSPRPPVRSGSDARFATVDPGWPPRRTSPLLLPAGGRRRPRRCVTATAASRIRFFPQFERSRPPESREGVPLREPDLDLALPAEALPRVVR